MFQKHFYIFFLSFVSLAVYGQQQKYIDSLQTKLTNANDSEKVNIYNGLAWAHKYSNPSLACKYAENAYSLSKELNNTTGQAIALNRMGAAKLKLGELSNSLSHILKAVKISKTYNQKKILATSLRQIGEVYEAQGNNPEAMKYYYNSLSIADSVNNLIGVARSALKVAGLYIKIKKYLNAKGYLNHAIKEFEKEQFLRGLHQAYLLKGDYYLSQNKQDSALLNYKIATGYLENLKDKQGHAIVTAKIAQVLEKQGAFNLAIAEYNKALDIFRILDDKKEIVHTYVILAKAYLSANNYKKGTYYAKMALVQAKELNLPNEEEAANYVLYSIYKKKNNQAKAILYLEDYLHLMDSLKHSEESWRVDQMRKSYDLEIQVKENELNTAIINNQALTIKNNNLLQNFLIVLVVIVILLAIIIWFAFRHAKTVNKQLVLANEEKNEAISLISHDLKSPFNKIKGLAHLLELQLSSADKTIKELISKINLIAYEGLSLVQNLVDIKALNSGSYAIKYTRFEINDFLQKRAQGFEQIAQSKHIKLIFHPCESSCYVLSDMNSIARIFDNILSNAIKFSPEEENVTIDCSKLEHNFSFSISDNGVGINEDDINTIFSEYKTGEATPTGTELSSGLGLAIATSLVRKLNGTIDCISKPGNGATFIVTLPLNAEEKNL